MKIKSRTKKILVLSIMVILLVTTGVLNFVLTDKLTAADGSNGAVQGGVTSTFFAAARSERETTRESEFLFLDAIINSDNSSASAKAAAEEEKLMLVKRMEQELAIETAIKGRGYDDVIVTIGDGGVSVMVGTAELTKTESNQIVSIVTSNTEIEPKYVKIISYV